MSDVFSVGTSALKSLQQAIATTGQNIANVNTPGYSRQTANFTANTPERLGSFYLGTGVSIDSVERAYDQFLTQDVQNRTSSFAFFDSLADTASRVDELFADPATGIGPALGTFFASMEAVANSPTTLPERQVVLAEAQTLAERFQYFDTRLSEFQTELNVRIQAAAGDVSQFAESIAALNEQISLQEAQTGGSAASDLLDLRDQTITELAELVKVTTVPQDDGSINVFIGRGQPLVIGANAEELTVQPNPLVANRLDVFLSAGASGSGGSNITSFLSEGTLGAAIDAGTDILDTARRNIGVLAAGVTSAFNAVHSAGFTLNDNTGVEFFDSAALNPTITVNSVNTGSLSATISDISKLTGSPYRITQGVGTDVQIVNLVTGTAQTVTGPTFTLEGVDYDITGGVQGDAWTVSPTEKAAENFGVVVTDPAEIAAAEIAGAPGDNRNILNMVGLQDESLLFGTNLPPGEGSANFFDVYSNTTSTIAVQTRRARSVAATEESLLTSASARKDNLSGVNLEEEAANLIRFQQGFQAAAQVISTTSEVFDILIRATE
ncbi:MAG: flagellar hook-associated protein FlgK [Halieaceae bacterium]|jgi:flagellar hook-associated protein 1 FlgK|nr:flagellar hook-associated protein FlgK [Halieaceae bacterium]